MPCQLLDGRAVRASYRPLSVVLSRLLRSAIILAACTGWWTFCEPGIWTDVVVEEMSNFEKSRAWGLIGGVMLLGGYGLNVLFLAWFLYAIVAGNYSVWENNRWFRTPKLSEDLLGSDSICEILMLAFANIFVCYGGVLITRWNQNRRLFDGRAKNGDEIGHAQHTAREDAGEASAEQHPGVEPPEKEVCLLNGDRGILRRCLPLRLCCGRG